MKLQECLINRKTGSVVVAAIGGFLGNRFSRRKLKRLATLTRPAAGALM